MICFCLFVLQGTGLSYAQDGFPSPHVLFLNESALQETRTSYRLDNGYYQPAIKKIFALARKAVTAKCISVVDKLQTPPSGDKHDYMSLAPYWWPDTSKPGGMPYIRRDGERNPEHDIVGDRINIGVMNERVWTLAVAYAISKDERYANAAIRQLKVWFLDPGTRMNPNLNYAQSIKGRTDGRGIGIIDTHGFKDIVDAMILLRKSPGWTAEIDKGLRTWFSSYLDWLLLSQNGNEECEAKNNHGSIYDVQVVSLSLFLGKEELARKVLMDAEGKRIAVQIEPDGSQPLELERTKSWGYSILNTEALVDLAVLGRHLGIDLWRFHTSDGRSLQKAVDFLIPYAIGLQSWQWTQIEPFEYNRLVPVLLQTAHALNDSTYRNTAQQLMGKFDRSSSVVFSLPVQ
jgi:hypothetical protein